jgi:CBS domain containing-hemolysin-like protein
VEDVLEQIVGEIEDEHDDRSVVPASEARDVEIEGTTSILDLESLYGIELPENEGFETLAGYLLFRLGHIPAAGESVEFNGRIFTVTSMEKNRIARVKIETTAARSTEKEAGIART